MGSLDPCRANPAFEMCFDKSSLQTAGGRASVNNKSFSYRAECLQVFSPQQVIPLMSSSPPPDGALISRS